MNDNNFLYNINKYSIKVNKTIEEVLKNNTLFISENELYIIFINDNKLSYKTFLLSTLNNSSIEKLIIENKITNYIIDNKNYNIFDIILGKYKISQNRMYIHGQNF